MAAQKSLKIQRLVRPKGSETRRQIKKTNPNQTHLKKQTNQDFIAEFVVFEYLRLAQLLPETSLTLEYLFALSQSTARAVQFPSFTNVVFAMATGYSTLQFVCGLPSSCQSKFVDRPLY